MGDGVDCEVAHHSHVHGAVALTQAGLIVAEDDIENPVQTVFDPPMAARGLFQLLLRKGGGANEQAAHDGCGSGFFHCGFDLGNCRQLGKTRFTGIAAVAGEPAGLVADSITPGSQPVMALVRVCVNGHADLRIAEVAANFIEEGGLVGLGRQRRVTATIDDGVGGRRVASDGIDGDDCPF